MSYFHNSGCHQSHRYCPSGFAAELSSCYMIGPQEMTWAQAKVRYASLPLIDKQTKQFRY